MDNITKFYAVMAWPQDRNDLEPFLFGIFLDEAEAKGHAAQIEKELPGYKAKVTSKYARHISGSYVSTYDLVK